MHVTWEWLASVLAGNTLADVLADGWWLATHICGWVEEWNGERVSGEHTAAVCLLLDTLLTATNKFVAASADCTVC